MNCNEMYDEPDLTDVPVRVRKSHAHQVPIRKLLRFLCVVRTLEGESKSLKELLDMTEMSDSAFRRWRHILNRDFGVQVLLERHHAHRRGAFATFRLQDFGIFDADAFAVIAEAHRHKEPFRLDETILNLGISTDVYARFLWSLAYRVHGETTASELTKSLKISIPTLSRYIRISRNVFLMDIEVTQSDTPLINQGAYTVASWGLIDWKKLEKVSKKSTYEGVMARLTQSKKPRMTLDKSPW